jgi:3',5'-nucleoside bisphosphate phosphatase
MKKSYRVDIHLHSQASDGVWTAGELVDEVEKEGVELFAVTDHNSVESVAAAHSEATRRGLYFLRGIEFDTSFEGNNYHILGYDIDIAHPSIRQLASHNLALAEERDEKTLQILEDRGYRIDRSAFEAYAHDPSRGGWKFLSFCIDEGICRDASDFFTRIFNEEQPLPYPIYRHPGEAVRSIEEAGGVPVLAHPYGSIGGGYPADRLPVFCSLAEAGIRGLECYSSYHSKEQTEAARSFCMERGLLITGGSDSHGPFTAKRKLGRPCVSTEDLRLGDLTERAGLPAPAVSR